MPTRSKNIRLIIAVSLFFILLVLFKPTVAVQNILNFEYSEMASHSVVSGSRNALIIGAKQGIGLNLAKKLHGRGWSVFGSVRSLDKDKDSIGELSAIASQIFEMDIQQEDTIATAADAFGKRPLDLLITCAGVGPNPTDMWDHSPEVLVEKFQVNTVGPFLAVKHFREALKLSSGGKVINISSNMASLSHREDNRRGGSIGYRLSKTALNQLTVSLSRTFAFEGTNVTVHAIHPGWIPTTMTGFTGPDDMDKQTSLIIDTIEKLGPEDSGRFMKADGEDFPW